MVTQHVNMFRNLETVVRELDDRGHETTVLHGTRLDDPRALAKAGGDKLRRLGRGIEQASADVPSLRTGYRPEPEDSRLHRGVRVGRLLMNRALYLRDSHPSPERVVDGLDKQLPARVRQAASRPAARWALGRELPLRLWRRAEAALPASRRLSALLREVAPDVVLVSPSIWPKGPIESDYIRAARRAGIPVVAYVNSWDNLTSKGTVHVLPDVFVVWNEPMAEEAREIHQIPPDVVRITGAPHLDHFFELEPTLPRAEACRQIGCPADAPYVVYLCSSRTLIADETPVVTRLADALAAQLPDRTPTVVVRPHPVNPGPWEGYSHPGVVVYPRGGDQADTPESWQDYFNQLTYAEAFVGLNTTAFLEAAVADRPCLTIVSDEFFAQQGRTGHFRHLLAADFLEVAADEAGLAAGIARVLHGTDAKAANRRRFAQQFLRPCGIGTPARTVVADLLEELASGRPAPRDAAARPPAEVTA